MDEAQRLPALFDALRGAVNADRQRMGGFFILASSRPILVCQVAERLAGGFPDALGAARRGGNFRDWREAYLRTYVERDLTVMGVGADPSQMRKLLTMLAHAQGGLSNHSQMASALGLSQPTDAGHKAHAACPIPSAMRIEPIRPLLRCAAASRGPGRPKGSTARVTRYARSLDLADSFERCIAWAETTTDLRFVQHRRDALLKQIIEAGKALDATLACSQIQAVA